MEEFNTVEIWRTQSHLIATSLQILEEENSSIQNSYYFA